ncbi:hypothetical protein WAI453_002487 [Rhynchosporium graminicola]
MMSSHQLAIAKASFSAGLLRPDPTSVSRDSIADFHSLLNTVIVQCSPKNVQKCKHWILENIAQSAARFTALGKYLNALTASFSEAGGTTDLNSKKREPSIKRKRLHVLYLVNDILYHSKHRSNDASICGKIQPILVHLFGSAASFTECPKHQRKVADLLSIWEEKGYYSKEYIEKLREAVKNASDAGEHIGTSNGDKEQGLHTKSSKLTPYVMPAMHGESSTPWFDLPAGNLMPHIIPNSTRPINPDLIKPLQFVAGPAEESLTLAVKALLDGVQDIFGGEDVEEKPSLDIDELGQPIIVDEISGDILEGEGYYGWSRTFCEKMKRRKLGLDVPGRGQRGQRSQSRSSSPGVRKRRYSQSDSDSGREYKSTRRRRSRSYSSSRSATPDAKRNKNGNFRRSRSRSLSRTPPPPSSSEPRALSEPPAFQRPPPPPPQQPAHIPTKPTPGFPQPPFHPAGFHQNLPIPPPPNMPAHFNNNQPQFGAWPPPPPQIPMQMQMPDQMQNMNFPPQYQNLHQQQQTSFWPPPPPPPGPPPGNLPGNYQHQQQGGYQQQQGGFQQHGGFAPSGPGGWQQPQQQQGRGYNNNNNNGWNNNQRGGRGGYRGRGW